jgi:hypothetical protein
LDTEPVNLYPEIDAELRSLRGRDKSELSFMYHFHRLQLLVMRKVGSKELAEEMLSEMELFREGLAKEIHEIREGLH